MFFFSGTFDQEVKLTNEQSLSSHVTYNGPITRMLKVEESLLEILDHLTNIQSIINVDCFVTLGFSKKFLLERYEESDEDEDTILNLNVAILNNQYQRIRATNPRLDLLIELSLDKEKSPEVGETDWTENNVDGPATSSLETKPNQIKPNQTLDSSVLSQMCLEEVGSKGCTISQFCWANMFSSTSRMYTATHMVLYNYMVATLHCRLQTAGKAAGVAAGDRLADLCSRILPEAEQLHQQIRKSLEKIDQCHIDLWLEQIGFCLGLGSDSRYFRPDWLDTLLTLTTPYTPCVVRRVPRCDHNETVRVVRLMGEKEIKRDQQIRKRRSDVQLETGRCSLHATGLLVMALSKYRQLLAM